jgi:hypothetical protein
VSDEYVRLVAPISFTMCDAKDCGGWLLVTSNGFARHAPFGKVCACEKPTITPRRVTHVSSVLVQAAEVKRE